MQTHNKQHHTHTYTVQITLQTHNNYYMNSQLQMEIKYLTT